MDRLKEVNVIDMKFLLAFTLLGLVGCVPKLPSIPEIPEVEIPEVEVPAIEASTTLPSLPIANELVT